MIFTQEQINEIKQRLALSGSKDLQFPLAELPLTGEEVIAIVQNGKNKRVSIEEFYEEFSQYIDGSERVDFFNVSRYAQRIADADNSIALTLAEAVELCPEDVKRGGQVITFVGNEGNWAIWQYKGTTPENWNDTETSWVNLDYSLMQALRKTPQILSEAEKTQARENIGAVSASEAVCVNKQNFNGTEKAQARKNIDAITASEAEQIAEDKIYETSVSSPEKLQTIQELAAWMESNPDSAATMNLQIQENAEKNAEQDEKLTELGSKQSRQDDILNGVQKVKGVWSIPTNGMYKELSVGLSMLANHNYQIAFRSNVAPKAESYPSVFDSEGNALATQTWSVGNTSCIFNYIPTKDHEVVTIGGYFYNSFDGAVVEVTLTKSESLVNSVEQAKTDIEQVQNNIEQIKKNNSNKTVYTNPISYGGGAVNGATGIYSDGILRITSSTNWGAGGFYMPSKKGKILVVSKLENTSDRAVTLTKNIGGNWNKYSDTAPAVDTVVNAFISQAVNLEPIAPNGVKYYAEIFDTDASYEYSGIIFMFIGLLEGDTMNVSTKLYSFTDYYSLFNPADEDIAKSLYDNGIYVESNNKSWEGKRLLAIGDSVTAMYYDSGLPETGYGFYSWADKVGSLLNMKVRKHAEGGIGLIQMVDGHGTDAPNGVDPDTFNNKVYKLNTDDVKDVDVIIVMGMYNEYGILAKDAGTVTDMYVDSTTGNTFMGRLNYAIKRIYEELAKANNLECKVLICGPHRHGKYPYSDEDAYQKGDLLSNSAKAVADYHSLHYIDLMHRGMINKYNWSVAQKSSVELSDNYISSTGINDGNNHPFASVNDAPSAASNKDKLITIVGKEYAYKSDGSTWVYGYVTCPWNADQLHPSIKGSDMIGEVIAGEINTIVI